MGIVIWREIVGKEGWVEEVNVIVWRIVGKEGC